MAGVKPSPWGRGPEGQIALVGPEGQVLFGRDGVAFHSTSDQESQQIPWGRMQRMAVEVPIMRQRSRFFVDLLYWLAGAPPVRRRSYFAVVVTEGLREHDWRLAPESIVLFSQKDARATENLFLALNEVGGLGLLADRARAQELIGRVYRLSARIDFVHYPHTRSLVKEAMEAAARSRP